MRLKKKYPNINHVRTKTPFLTKSTINK